MGCPSGLRYFPAKEAAPKKVRKFESFTHRHFSRSIMYTEKVTFDKTGLYGCGPIGHDDVYTVAEFKSFCKDGAFIDYDGFGCPVKDKLADPSIDIKPSKLHEIPDDATHIVWYNR